MTKPAGVDRLLPVTGKIFMTHLANAEIDIVQRLLDLIAVLELDYCAINCLAVNAFVEPVISLDIEIVVVADGVDALATAAAETFRVKHFPHSVNLNTSSSDLRIQLQTDPRYQPFLLRAKKRDVLGYTMRVAALEDVLQGKLWAYADASRRGSKRQKTWRTSSASSRPTRDCERNCRIPSRLSSELRRPVGAKRGGRAL